MDALFSKCWMWLALLRWDEMWNSERTGGNLAPENGQRRKSLKDSGAARESLEKEEEMSGRREWSMTEWPKLQGGKTGNFSKFSIEEVVEDFGKGHFSEAIVSEPTTEG